MIRSVCRVPAVVAAVSLLVVGLAACAEAPISPVAPKATPTGADFAGLSRWHWTLTRIAVGGKSFAVPVAAQGWLQISPDHGATGGDGCASFSGAAQMSGTSLTLHQVAVAGIGCLPGRGALDATRVAMNPLIAGAPATVHLLGSTLVLDLGGRTLTFTRSAPAPTIPGTAASSVQLQAT